ncbi:hypothetical protein T4B_9734, partial [Trichinella pseudospiralis]
LQTPHILENKKQLANAMTQLCDLKAVCSNRQSPPDKVIQIDKEIRWKGNARFIK